MAGARAGLAGERSGLFMEQIRVVKEMRDADERRGRTAHTVRPRYMCWENVPGAFSSAGGEDFRIVLEEIVRIKDSSCSVPRPDSGRWESAGAIILGDQFSLAWRVLDAQFWGVAQRRKRIFLVADFAGRSASQILFEQDRLPEYPASGGGPGQGTPASAPGSPASPGRAGPIGFDGYNGDLTGEKAATLGVNCGMSTGRNGVITAFAANQRDEVRDLHDVAAALAAQPGMKQQTFVAGITAKGNGDCFLSEERHTSLSGGGGMPGQGYPAIFTAGFSAGQGSTAGGIGFQTECSPTLKASESGSNMVPSILCLNDQGGSIMACSEDVAGTLRAQEHGHQPLVFDNHGQDTRFLGPVQASQTVSATFGMGGNNQPLVVAKRQNEDHPALYENHGIDARYTGPHAVAPTMSARYGTGGNNVPLVRQKQEMSCPIFSRQRVDVFRDDTVASTQSARQHKDATDLVLDVAGLDCRNGRENGDLCGTLQQGTTGSSLNSIHPVRTGRLIRRLTPLECERLQGFPDHWTDLPNASDSARYKALGNSVAIPCVDFVLRGIAYFLGRKEEIHP